MDTTAVYAPPFCVPVSQLSGYATKSGVGVNPSYSVPQFQLDFQCGAFDVTEMLWALLFQAPTALRYLFLKFFSNMKKEKCSLSKKLV